MVIKAQDVYHVLGLRVKGVKGLGFRIKGLGSGFEVQGIRFRVYD